MIKLSKIRKLPNGKYRVLSEKGKNLGTFPSYSRAKKHLRQVEYFKYLNKHKKANHSFNTFSEAVRFFRKHHPSKLNRFLNFFKQSLNKVQSENLENCEQIALLQALKLIEMELNAD